MEGSDIRGEDRIFTEAFQKNMSQIDLIRTVLSLVTGALCGILGLQGIRGLAFFIIVNILIGFAIAAPMRHDTKLYTNVSLFSLIIQGMQGQAMSFIMAWTLSYSLVYIY